MSNLSDGLGLQGKYRTIVHRAATGKTEISEWKVNTIDGSLKNAVGNNFETTSDFAMDALFDGDVNDDNVTPPTTEEDGIVIHKSTGAYYEMISSISGSDNSRTITGTFTGVAGTFDDVGLGQSYEGLGDGKFNNHYANPTAWDNVILAIADTLTVEWTITVGA